eukprot:4524512-Pleurochrysis_carterae.AAC.2
MPLAHEAVASWSSRAQARMRVGAYAGCGVCACWCARACERARVPAPVVDSASTSERPSAARVPPALPAAAIRAFSGSVFPASTPVRTQEEGDRERACVPPARVECVRVWLRAGELWELAVDSATELFMWLDKLPLFDPLVLSPVRNREVCSHLRQHAADSLEFGFTSRRESTEVFLQSRGFGVCGSG